MFQKFDIKINCKVRLVINIRYTLFKNEVWSRRELKLEFSFFSPKILDCIIQSVSVCEKLFQRKFVLF